MNDLISWLRQQLDTDEQWALAANQPYRHADEGSKASEGGVHWRWVTGDQWETTTPDPVTSEFVDGPGEACWLVTVEEWPITHDVGGGRTITHHMPRRYADQIVEMDAAAAGHIIRHDPARVLRQVQAHRAILDAYEGAVAEVQYDPHDETRSADESTLQWVVGTLASIYSDRDGYRAEWSA